MNNIRMFVFLPMLALSCPYWHLSNTKNLYILPKGYWLEVQGDMHEFLYEIKNIEIKNLACLAKSINTTLEISGIPLFTREEVIRLYEIPDHCLSERYIKPTESNKTLLL